jgi:hypothetical protein
MTILAHGHVLKTLRDGITGFADGDALPMPLAATRIEVDIRAGLAVVTTTRTFRNREAQAIEAVMTFPIGFDTVVTSLSAVMGGRRLKAVAKSKSAARETYEDAIDRGKAAVLHEEVLRGVHVLSVANLAPGEQVEVTVEAVTPLSWFNGHPFLRIPTTVGQVYGASPFLPADDLVTDRTVRHEAELVLKASAGTVHLLSSWNDEARRTVSLDRPIHIIVPGMEFGVVTGHDGRGKPVTVTLKAHPSSSGRLDLAVLVDKSGSMDEGIGKRGRTKFEAVRVGLLAALSGAQDRDQLAIWEFDNACRHVRTATGVAARLGVAELSAPDGGTELGKAIDCVAASGARDILVITDGQTYASEVSQAVRHACRISAVLVGEGSLDAMIGHLAALTGGEVFYVPGDEASSTLSEVFEAFRRPGAGAHALGGHEACRHEDPLSVSCTRGGVVIQADWREGPASGTPDALGRFAAAMALPLIADPSRAEAFAAEQGLCTHLTSLVLVDEASATQEGVPGMRKVALMAPRESVAYMPAALAMPELRQVACRVDPHQVAESAAEFEHALPLRRSTSGDPSDPFAADPNAVLAGDLSSLPEDLRRRILSLAGQAPIVTLAAVLGRPVEAVAAALVAELMNGRQAARVARRVLSAAPAHLLQAARNCQGGR